MRRSLAGLGLVVSLFAGVLHGQSQFAIRAASADSVEGWTRTQFPDGNRTVWVAPTGGLTSADIQRAQPATDGNGGAGVGITFTEAGAGKMRELSKAQMNKLVALVLDGTVIWAPLVRGEIGNQALITGDGPNGLRPEVVQRIQTAINQK